MATPRSRRPGLPVTIGWILAVALAGLVVAVAGNLLRSTLCVGGGSECKGASPVSSVPGTVLYVLGSVMLVGSPVLGVLLARWRRPRADR